MQSNVDLGYNSALSDESPAVFLKFGFPSDSFQQIVVVLLFVFRWMKVG